MILSKSWAFIQYFTCIILWLINSHIFLVLERMHLAYLKKLNLLKCLSLPLNVRPFILFIQMKKIRWFLYYRLILLWKFRYEFEKFSNLNILVINFYLMITFSLSERSKRVVLFVEIWFFLSFFLDYQLFNCDDIFCPTNLRSLEHKTLTSCRTCAPVVKHVL